MSEFNSEEQKQSYITALEEELRQYLHVGMHEQAEAVVAEVERVGGVVEKKVKQLLGIESKARAAKSRLEAEAEAAAAAVRGDAPKVEADAGEVEADAKKTAEDVEAAAKDAVDAAENA